MCFDSILNYYAIRNNFKQFFHTTDPGHYNPKKNFFTENGNVKTRWSSHGSNVKCFQHIPIFFNFYRYITYNFMGLKWKFHTWPMGRSASFYGRFKLIISDQQILFYGFYFLVIKNLKKPLNLNKFYLYKTKI